MQQAGTTDAADVTDQASQASLSGQAGQAGQVSHVGQVRQITDRIRTGIGSVIEGKDDVVGTAVAVLLAEGHLLVEDVPGVGKTVLSKALARSFDLSITRIQFTPDLLPSDITGVSVYHPERHAFEFQPGAVFANIVIADEINRGSPKTQSALLESMAERQVTIDGRTHPLERPFLVVATQNPHDMAGTFELPEAQRDRFTARLSLGYPAPAAEVAMLAAREGHDPLENLRPVTDAAGLRHLIDAVTTVHVASSIHRYAVDLCNATRRSATVRLGASPRATLQLVRVAKARAAMAGRPYVVPEDLTALARDVLSHRIVLTGEALAAGWTPASMLDELVAAVPVPDGAAPVP